MRRACFSWHDSSIRSPHRPGNALHGSYDKDDIPVKTMAEIRKKYVTDSRFTPEAAEKASKAAAGMCKWVYAMETYDRVAKVSSNASVMSWYLSGLSEALLTVLVSCDARWKFKEAASVVS